MRFAYWITKATDTHSESVILIALPRQQWLRERATVSRCTYIVLLRFVKASTTSLAQMPRTGNRTTEYEVELLIKQQR
jgi:hypothetical protein